MKNFSLLINGELVPGASTMDVVNPATEEVIAQCPRADLNQLNDAVSAAKAAFPEWANTDVDTRRQNILAIADDLEARIEEFGQLLTAEQGKPLADAMEEVGGTAMIMRLLAGFDLEEKVISDDPMGKFVEHRTPLGVVAAITPWNVPTTILGVKITPALLMGNTVVAKPAPTTPLTSLLLAEVCSKHLPAGVLNVIADANDLGSALTTHQDVAKVSFTGSTATGKRVLESASNSLKRVTLELGGNDAAIVLDDMEPKEAAEKLFAGSMVNCGQICLAVKRAFVPDAIYDEVCEELAKLADNAVVGDGSQPGVEIGPLQNKMQYERVKELIESARSDGTIIAGGEYPAGPGYFVKPTIVRDIDDDARLVREEQFGPVLPVLRYSDLNDAVARANDTDFGLGGTVWSKDPQRAADVAKDIDAGIVWVNSHMAISPAVPVGGSKQSGLGLEMGFEGMLEFTQRHVVYTPPAP